jgi:hypothetical protein
MSIRIMQRVWDYSEAREGALLVLLAIADNADSETGEAWPSIKLLAQKTRLSPRAVSYATKKLVDLGEIEVLERGGRKGERGRANRYRVTLSDHMQDLQVGTVPTCNTRHPNMQSETPLYREPSVEPSISPQSDENREVAGEVFTYWQRVLGRETSRLTKARREKIRARLNAGATVDQMKRAIDGCAGSEFHRAGGHTDLTLILRSEEKMEAFCQMPRPEADEDDFFAGVNG